MANFTIKFHSDRDFKTLESFQNTKVENEIVIRLSDIDNENISISLNVSTAIKFAKHLRCEINKVKG